MKHFLLIFLCINLIKATNFLKELEIAAFWVNNFSFSFYKKQSDKIGDDCTNSKLCKEGLSCVYPLNSFSSEIFLTAGLDLGMGKRLGKCYPICQVNLYEECSLDEVKTDIEEEIALSSKFEKILLIQEMIIDFYKNSLNCISFELKVSKIKKLHNEYCLKFLKFVKDEIHQDSSKVESIDEKETAKLKEQQEKLNQTYIQTILVYSFNLKTVENRKKFYKHRLEKLYEDELENHLLSKTFQTNVGGENLYIRPLEDEKNLILKSLEKMKENYEKDIKKAEDTIINDLKKIFKIGVINLEINDPKKFETINQKYYKELLEKDFYKQRADLQAYFASKMKKSTGTKEDSKATSEKTSKENENKIPENQIKNLDITLDSFLAVYPIKLLTEELEYYLSVYDKINQHFNLDPSFKQENFIKPDNFDADGSLIENILRSPFMNGMCSVGRIVNSDEFAYVPACISKKFLYNKRINWLKRRQMLSMSNIEFQIEKKVDSGQGKSEF